jgi:predicted phosphohydrolase
MELQYASDLHIDDHPGSNYGHVLTPVAPVLLLAGDLCGVWKPEYAAFLRWCSERWGLVLVITGNHEYFCPPGIVKTMEETDAEARRIATSFENVVFLQSGESVLIPGTTVRVVGATLWSAVDPAIHDELHDKGDYTVSYTATPVGIRTTTPMDVCALHALHKAQLQSALASHPSDRLILMTHHLPTRSLVPVEHKENRYSSCYASADDDLFLHENLKAVVCGHSHKSVRIQLPTGPLAVLNARGYRSEVGRTGYSPRATVRI